MWWIAQKTKDCKDYSLQMNFEIEINKIAKSAH